MQSPLMVQVVQQLHKLAEAPLAGQSSDGELLEMFVGNRDEAAFATLLDRHGPMVAAVCRRQLRESHDAEDAYQATFLVLARKAATIRKRDALGNWLLGVALRVCRKARCESARHAREAPRATSPSSGNCDALTWGEIRTVLDEELASLPASCAAPLIVCFLEGVTQEEAAKRLGLSKSTLRRRLERGKKLLHSRLARRGVTLSAGLGAALLSSMASAAMPKGLTLKAALQFAVHNSLEAAAITRPIALAQAVLPSFVTAKGKLTALATLAILLASAVGLGAYVALAEKDATPLPVLQAQGESKPVQAPVDLFGDPLPADALARLGTIRLQHGMMVNAIAFAPDGKSLATASMDSMTHRWETSTGKELLRIDTHMPKPRFWDMASSLTFTPDGKVLGGARVNQLPCIWDIATGKEIRTFGDRSYRAQWLAFSPDGKTVACGGKSDNESGGRLFDVESGALIHKFAAATDTTKIAFSPDKKTLASSDNDGLLFYEFAGGKIRALPRPEAQGERLHSLVFSGDGKWLAGISANKAVVVAEAPSGKTLLKFSVAKEKDTTYSVLLTPDDKTLITGHRDGFVRYWDAKTGSKQREFRAHRHEVWRIALSPDGKTLATTANYGPSESQHTVLLWDAATCKPLLPEPSPRAGIARIAVSTDSRRMATTSWDGSTQMWDPVTGKQIWKTDHFGPIAFTSDGRMLISGGWSEGVIRFLDARTGKQLRQITTDQKSIPSLALSSDGKFLAALASDGFLIWDVPSGKVVQQLAGQKDHAYDFALTPDGKLIATFQIKEGNLASIVRVWDTGSGKLIREHQEPPTGGGIAFSADGKILAYGLRLGGKQPRQLIRLRDAKTGQTIRDLDENTASFDTLAFSPDGHTLICGGQHSDELFLWEVATGKLRRKFLGHQGHLTCVTFSPDGRWMASGATDASVLIWDAVGQRSRQNPPALLSDAALNRLWADLAGDDAVVAYQAISTLRAAPKPAVALFEQYLKPVPRVDNKKVTEALRQMESDQFTIRNQAAKELERLGEAAEPALRKALAGNPTLEMRRRIEQLLDRLTGTELLRQTRAFEVLENAGDSDSCRLLQAISTGAPNARLTMEAQAALMRLGNDKR